MRSTDVTSRAAIRNAALRLFAERGTDGVTVRQIAEAAGVSPALVVHHYGSKAGLRAAVDEHVAAQFDALFEDPDAMGEMLTGGTSASIAELFAQAFPEDLALPAYLRRLLLDADPVGLALFRRWHEMTRQLLDQLVAAEFARPTQDPEVRSAFLLAADLALLILREPITDVLGIDPLSNDGLARWAADVTRIYRDGVFIPPSVEEPTHE